MNKEIFDGTMKLYELVSKNLDDWEKEKGLLIQQKQHLERQLHQLSPGWRTGIKTEVPIAVTRHKKTTGNPSNDIVLTAVLELLYEYLRPVSASDLLVSLKKQNIILRGIDPIKVLNGRLERSNNLFTKYSDGWMITGSESEVAWRTRSK